MGNAQDMPKSPGPYSTDKLEEIQKYLSQLTSQIGKNADSKSDDISAAENEPVLNQTETCSGGQNQNITANSKQVNAGTKPQSGPVKIIVTEGKTEPRYDYTNESRDYDQTDGPDQTDSAQVVKRRLAVNRQVERQSRQIVSDIPHEELVNRELLNQFKSEEDLHRVIQAWTELLGILKAVPHDLVSTLMAIKRSLFATHQFKEFAQGISDRMKTDEYKGHYCQGKKVLVIGGGPCGLRFAIEALLLGAEVHVIEKRGYISRNNILHLWEFVKKDLLSLGIKVVFPKFCIGEVNHISIKDLQIALLKLALILGVHFHVPVAFTNIRHPTQTHGWRIETDEYHEVTELDFDAIVDASGKRGVVPGFNRRKFCPRESIAITANFENRNTMEEKHLEQIPGKSVIYCPTLFKELKNNMDIALENLVYYKDRNSHYFVMTIFKQTLFDKYIAREDYEDIQEFLSPSNIDMGRLKYAAQQVAHFATHFAIGNLVFCQNHKGEDDIALFEFASRQEAVHSCQVLDSKGRQVLLCLVGDSLFEPFWPEGTGIARGFLGTLDAVWLLREWCRGRGADAIRERENLLTLLPQTKCNDLKKGNYTINPKTRYERIPTKITRQDAEKLVKAGDYIELTFQKHSPEGNAAARRKKFKRRNSRRNSEVRRDDQLTFFRTCLRGYEDLVEVEDLDESWKDGVALCCLIHKVNPALIDLKSIDENDRKRNFQMALDILEKDYGVMRPGHLHTKLLQDQEEADNIVMHVYLGKVKVALKPHFGRLLRRNSWMEDEDTKKQQENEPLKNVLRRNKRRSSKSLSRMPSVSEEEKPEEKRKSVFELANQFEERDRKSRNLSASPKSPNLLEVGAEGASPQRRFKVPPAAMPGIDEYDTKHQLEAPKIHENKQIRDIPDSSKDPDKDIDDRIVKKQEPKSSKSKKSVSISDVPEIIPEMEITQTEAMETEAEMQGIVSAQHDEKSKAKKSVTISEEFEIIPEEDEEIHDEKPEVVVTPSAVVKELDLEEVTEEINLLVTEPPIAAAESDTTSQSMWSNMDDEVFEPFNSLSSPPQSPTLAPSEPVSDQPDSFSIVLLQLSDLQQQMESLKHIEDMCKRNLQTASRNSLMREEALDQLEQVVLQKSDLADKIFRLMNKQNKR